MLSLVIGWELGLGRGKCIRLDPGLVAIFNLERFVKTNGVFSFESLETFSRLALDWGKFLNDLTRVGRQLALMSLNGSFYPACVVFIDIF